MICIMTIFYFMSVIAFFFGFFLPDSCRAKIFKAGIRIISIIKCVSIIVYIIMNA